MYGVFLLEDAGSPHGAGLPFLPGLELCKVGNGVKNGKGMVSLSAVDDGSAVRSGTAGVQVRGRRAGDLSVDPLRRSAGEEMERAPAGANQFAYDRSAGKTGACRKTGAPFRCSSWAAQHEKPGRSLRQSQGRQRCGLPQGGVEAGVRTVELLGQPCSRRVPVIAQRWL